MPNFSKNSSNSSNSSKNSTNKTKSAPAEEAAVQKNKTNATVPKANTTSYKNTTKNETKTPSIKDKLASKDV